MEKPYFTYIEAIITRRVLMRAFPEIGTNEEMNGADTVEALCSLYKLASADRKRIDPNTADRLNETKFLEIVDQLGAWFKAGDTSDNETLLDDLNDAISVMADEQPILDENQDAIDL